MQRTECHSKCHYSHTISQVGSFPDSYGDKTRRLRFEGLQPYSFLAPEVQGRKELGPRELNQ